MHLQGKYGTGIGLVILAVATVVGISTCNGCKKRKAERAQIQIENQWKKQKGKTSSKSYHSEKSTRYFDFPPSGEIELCLISGYDITYIGKDGGVNITQPDGLKDRIEEVGISTCIHQNRYHQSGYVKLERDASSIKGVMITNYWEDSCPN